jgi:threonine dehydratase
VPSRSIRVSIEDIRVAQKNISGSVLRTPLVPLNYEEAPCEIYLKLECLQPTGSFKVRGAGNALALTTPESKKLGVYTCSAGNMAQALAWHAKKQNIDCVVIVPDSAPETKLSAIRRYGAQLVQLPWDEVWQVATSHVYPPLSDRIFVHPFADPGMIAGNGTIGLEILEDLPDVESIVVPFGGGGLFSGIATAAKSLKPSVKTYASEADTAASLHAALNANHPIKIERVPSFVDGIGSSVVLDEIWEFAKPLLNGSIPVSLAKITSSIKILAERNRVIAEGAAGSSLAAALTGQAGKGKVVCIVSGGNIDTSKFVKILQGETP